MRSEIDLQPKEQKMFAFLSRNLPVMLNPEPEKLEMMMITNCLFLLFLIMDVYVLFV